MSYFINTPYRLVVRTNIDLSAATDLVIQYRTPYGRNGEWVANAEGNNAVFNIGSSNITQRGTYKMQVEAVIDGSVRRSSFASLTFIEDSI